MAREDDPSILGRLQILMQDETGPGKLITYGLASAGLLAALYKIRPFARFTKPSDVPLHFLQSRVPLQGTVRRVEPSSSKVLLMVDHRPLLPFPRFNKAYLPVKIGGVEITGNGVSWLQTVLNGKLVTFLPIVREKEYLECVVAMSEKDRVSLEIGEELVKLGLATVHEPWTKLKDKQVLAYKNSLANAQKWAVRRRNGYWHFVKQPTVLWKTQMFMIDKMKSLLPAIVVRRLDL
ncbi:protein C3orf33 [Temnothorax americanus]|uniref:protein C3orf33 n=1 Tax=Temnothorax americanus TaxID=1964332 RepID=UPI0040686CDE